MSRFWLVGLVIISKPDTSLLFEIWTSLDLGCSLYHGNTLPDELPSEESELSPLEDPEFWTLLFFVFFSGFSSPSSSDLPVFAAADLPVLGMMFERERETNANRSFRLLSASRFFNKSSKDVKFSSSRSTKVACWQSGQNLVEKNYFKTTYSTVNVWIRN